MAMIEYENDLRINISNKAHIEALNSILSKSINYYSIIVFVNKNKIYFRNDESEYRKKSYILKKRYF
ncbi:hypothetical protein [Metamycoplasma hominis]|uniref:hypothetical protein n=1 Tax=Metamycoplasma hominis TaxID=2098 RepID=UPI0011BD5448|nr:hypothetical protein [Metamycoplasma hominis]